mgnify:CR=1 FL=1
MNLLISIFLFLLLIIFSLPIFTPKVIYIIYLKCKGKIGASSKYNTYIKLSITTSIILLILWVAVFIIGFLSYFRAINFMYAFLVVLPIRILLFLIFNYSFKFNFPNNIKSLNFILNIIILIFSAFFVFFATTINDKIENGIPKNIPENIVNFANDNKYTIMLENHINLTDNGITTNRYFINNTSTYLFFIDIVENKIVTYDKEFPHESYETQYHTLHKIDRMDVETIYSNILDNLYLGANYRPIYYLFNEDEILSVYGLFEKDKETKEFYISKYLLFNMTKDELTELVFKTN